MNRRSVSPNWLNQMEEDKEPKSNSIASSERSAFSQSYANRVIVLFAILAAFVLFVDIMLTPSLPKIALDYKVSIAEVSLVISLYTVFGTAVNPVIGKLGDIVGKKRILVYVLIIYCIMVAATSFASNFTILLISRTVQGVGLGIFPLAFSLVREEFPREMVPRAQGILSAMFGAGAAFGLPIGAFIANSYGWQANYHIALPFIVALTVLIFFTVKESQVTDPNAKLDYVGAVWLGITLGAIVFGLSEGSTWGWTSPRVLGLIFGGFASMIPLVLFERRVLEPILNLRLLRVRNVLVSNTLAISSGTALFIAFQAITFQLELKPPAGYGFDIFTTGIYLLPLAVAILIVAIPVGRLIPKFGCKPFLFIGGVLGAIGFYLVSTATTASQIAEFLVVASAGLGIMMVATQNLLVLSVRKREMGLTTSLNTVFRNIGSSLGAPIAGSLMSTFVVSYVLGGQTFSLPSKSAFHYAYYIAIAGFAVSLIISLFAQEVMGKRANKQVLEQSGEAQDS
jgi:MFS family permease